MSKSLLNYSKSIITACEEYKSAGEKSSLGGMLDIIKNDVKELVKNIRPSVVIDEIEREKVFGCLSRILLKKVDGVTALQKLVEYNLWYAYKGWIDSFSGVSFHTWALLNDESEIVGAFSPARSDVSSMSKRRVLKGSVLKAGAFSAKILAHKAEDTSKASGDHRALYGRLLPDFVSLFDFVKGGRITELVEGLSSLAIKRVLAEKWPAERGLIDANVHVIPIVKWVLGNLRNKNGFTLLEFAASIKEMKILEGLLEIASRVNYSLMSQEINYIFNVIIEPSLKGDDKMRRLDALWFISIAPDNAMRVWSDRCLSLSVSKDVLDETMRIRTHREGSLKEKFIEKKSEASSESELEDDDSSSDDSEISSEEDFSLSPDAIMALCKSRASSATDVNVFAPIRGDMEKLTKKIKFEDGRIDETEKNRVFGELRSVLLTIVEGRTSLKLLVTYELWDIFLNMIDTLSGASFEAWALKNKVDEIIRLRLRESAFVDLTGGKAVSSTIRTDRSMPYSDRGRTGSRVSIDDCDASSMGPTTSRLVPSAGRMSVKKPLFDITTLYNEDSIRMFKWLFKSAKTGVVSAIKTALSKEYIQGFLTDKVPLSYKLSGFEVGKDAAFCFIKKLLEMKDQDDNTLLTLAVLNEKKETVRELLSIAAITGYHPTAIEINILYTHMSEALFVHAGKWGIVKKDDSGVVITFTEGKRSTLWKSASLETARGVGKDMFEVVVRDESATP